MSGSVHKAGWKNRRKGHDRSAPIQGGLTFNKQDAKPTKRRLRREKFAAQDLSGEEIRRRYIKNRHEEFLCKKQYPGVDYDRPRRERVEARERRMHPRKEPKVEE